MSQKKWKLAINTIIAILSALAGALFGNNLNI